MTRSMLFYTALSGAAGWMTRGAGGGLLIVGAGAALMCKQLRQSTAPEQDSSTINNYKMGFMAFLLGRVGKHLYNEYQENPIETILPLLATLPIAIILMVDIRAAEEQLRLAT